MLIPRYWATHTAKYRQGRTRFAIQRFGWSLTSQQEAEDMARTRAGEAVQERLAGRKPIRREPKVPYNGAEGVPIREEIVATHGGIVITRNSYGARCMNVADVCFVDVDETPKKERSITIYIFFEILNMAFGFFIIGTMLFTLGASFSIKDTPSEIYIAWSVIIITGITRYVIHLLSKTTQKKLTSWLEKLASEEKNAGFRLYKTPAGFRVIATHKTFDPAGDEVAQLFKRLRTDPVYALMCLRQKCFRARVSAKPWRIGISDHMRPTRGVWPVSEEKMPRRASWIEAYEKQAAQFAACHFIATFGSTAMPAEVSAAVQLHDELCAALSDKPCA